MQKRFSRTLFGVAILLLPLAAHAACHVVTPSGSGAQTGADWNNALAGLPANLISGDTYYLADGKYLPYANTTANTTIKKAIASDNCTATGWNTGTMGSAQAVFQPTASSNFGRALKLEANNQTVDGNSAANWHAGTTAAAAYGIKLDGSTCDSASWYCWNLIVGDSGSVSGIVVKYVEVAGSGATDAANLAHEDENVTLRATTGFTFSYGYIHDSSGDPVEMVGVSSNIQVDHSYIWKNDSTPTYHGECMASNGSVSNIFIFDNILQDCEGTAFIDSLNSGNSVTDDNWQIYNNVGLYSPNNSTGRTGCGDGFVCCCGNGVSQACTNWKIVNNTVLNYGGGGAAGNGGVIWQGGATTTGTPIIQNNLFWNNPLGEVFNVPAGSTVDHNSCIGPNDNGACTGTGAVNTTSTTPIPFVNWTVLNFNLASDNAEWNNRISLGAPFDTDAGGNPFTTDRGAYQYGSATASSSAPSGLTATVQ